MKRFALVLLVPACLAFTFSEGLTQVPKTLSYQGVLTDTSGTQVPDGQYQLTFNLYDQQSGGSSLWAETQTSNVEKGVFSVVLGKIAPLMLSFDTGYWLGIAVDGGPELSPRTELTASAYSLNAAAISDSIVTGSKIADGQVVRSLNGITDDVNMVAGPNISITPQGDSLIIASSGGGGGSLWSLSGNNVYYNNGNVGIGTTNPTARLDISGNISISGNGTVGGTLTGNIINATTQFNIGNNRVLSNAGTNNLFAGVNSGNGNTTGNNNSFFGTGAGALNTTGGGNSFFGRSAGNTNTEGSNNTLIGSSADLGANNLTNATAIGNRAFVALNNSLVLGSVKGKNGATSDINIGIGTTTPDATLDIEIEKALPNITPDIRLTNYGRFPYLSFRSSRGIRPGPTATTSDDILLILGADGYNGSSFTGSGAASIYFTPTENWNTVANGTKISFLTTANGSTSPGTRMTINHDGNVGIGPGLVNTAPAQRLDVNGSIRVGPLSTNLGCIEDRDGTVIAGSCSSDLRFKKNITVFENVLNGFSRLRPVHFFWRADEFPNKQFGTNKSFGLIAQEVEQIFPDLVTTDEQGFKAVNYSKVPLYTVQAVIELKAEVDLLKQQLQRQQDEIDELKRGLTELVKLNR